MDEIQRRIDEVPCDEEDLGEIAETRVIVGVTDYGFRFYPVIGAIVGIRTGFVVQNEYGDRRVLFEEEVSFHGEKTDGFEFYAYTDRMQRAIERGFDKWQRRK